MNDLLTQLKLILRDPVLFADVASGLKLRSYQLEAAQAILDSVLARRGDTFVVIFPRQSGKNELQAQIEAYLLTLLSPLDAEIVKVSPTWKPQSLNAMRRLERVLSRNLIARAMWVKESGYIYRLGRARIFFLSGGATANVVGATASTLLECDEAQDVSPAKWDKEIGPMAASTNATRVFWGTAWTSQTLLAREKRLALEAQRRDGRRRVFELTAEQVAQEVPAYGRFVQAEIARFGRGHPFVRTQFFSEEIEPSDSGMFPPARLALLLGDHPPYLEPLPGRMYAFLVDVGGSKGEERLIPPFPEPYEHDATVVTIVEVDASLLSDPLIHAARYLVACRHVWEGMEHSDQYSSLHALIEKWRPLRCVIDATGIGEGLASFLGRAFPSIVRPFKFTRRSKSDLGWSLISLVETGRLKEHCPPSEELLRQAKACQLTILPGEGKQIEWGAPPRRDEKGRPLHDDYLVSLALAAVLDKEAWGEAHSAIIAQTDPLDELKAAY